MAAFVLGVGETLFDTAAQSIMPNIVSREQLSLANGRLYAVEMVMNQFIGPPLGGLLVAISVPLALAGSILAYALAAVGLAVMVGTFRAAPDGPRASMLADIREGMGYLLRHRVLRTLAIMVAVSNLASAAVFAVFVVFAVAPGPMDLDAFGYGVLMTGFAAGAILGTVTEPTAERRLGRSNVLFLTVIVTSASMLVLGPHAEPTGCLRGAGGIRGDDDVVERHHRLPAPAHHAGPSARPRQRRLPLLRLGFDAHRGPARRTRR